MTSAKTNKQLNKYYVSQARAGLYKNTRTVYDFYDQYTGDIDKSSYVKIAKDFFTELSREIILNRFKFKLPSGLGVIRIQKKRNKPVINAKRIDWAKTKELNKKVYHLNLHTSGNYFKFLWERGRVVNSRLYSFYPVRKNKRFLASEIKRRATDPMEKDYDCLS